MELTTYDVRVKQALEASSVVPVTFIQHEFSADGLTEYRYEYSFADCNIRLAYEDGTVVTSDEFDKIFSKPMVVIYSTLDNYEIVASGNLLVEFNLLCNTKDAGRIKLDAYTQLCQILLNPLDFGGYWTQYGLLPRGFQTTPAKDGKVIDPDLTGRLLLRSVLARFSILGELYGAR